MSWKEGSENANDTEPTTSEQKCPTCGSSDLFSDSTVGLVCLACSTVVDENFLVSSTEFTKQGDGSSKVNGQMVGEFSAAYNGLGGVNMRLLLPTAHQSRIRTLSLMKSHLHSLSETLGLGANSSTLVDSAFRTFTLLQQRSFLKGRNAKTVAAVCLYVSCRLSKVPMWLVHFSEATRTDHYELGKVYTAVKRRMCFELPPLKMGPFIERFAAELDLGQKDRVVVKSAKRLADRLSKDYIDAGRKPAGLIAAVLLIACRMHGFSRTEEDVIECCKISSGTIRKRLKEFETTASSRLTVHEFMTTELPSAEKPPILQIADKEKDIPRILDGSMGSEDEDDIDAILNKAKSGNYNPAQKKAEKRRLNEDKFYKSLAEEMKDALAQVKDLSETEMIEIEKEGENEESKDDADNEEEMEFEDDIGDKALVTRRVSFEDEDDLDVDELSVASDDEEITNAILTDEQIKVRTAIFRSTHKEYLDTQKRKRKLSSNEKSITKEAKKVNFETEDRTFDNLESAAAFSVANAVKNDKRISDKIDYDKWEELFNIPIENADS